MALGLSGSNGGIKKTNEKKQCQHRSRKWTIDLYKKVKK